MTKTIGRLAIFLMFACGSANVHAQSAVVDVGVSPTGSFQIKSSEVRGFAERKGDTFSAKNITVGLKNLKTGIPLRDTHTKKYLEVDKYPDAILTTGLGRGGKGVANLQVKGIAQKVRGTYEIKGEALVAKFPLKLSNYKINDVKYLGVGVDDEVNLTVTVPIRNASPAATPAATATATPAAAPARAPASARGP